MTLILLNLCVSLVCLILVMYIADHTAHTHGGCAAANVLRYYLVMVSLMWNGVEAYNMYLMLVKVFDKGVPRMVLKAGFVAWGWYTVWIICSLYPCTRDGYT